MRQFLGNLWKHRARALVFITIVGAPLSTYLITQAQVTSSGGNNWAMWIANAGTMVSAWSLLITAYIGLTQDKQLTDITSVAEQTKSIALELQVEAMVSRRVKAFFKLSGRLRHPQYVCHRLEHVFDGEEVPFTPITEDHCVQIIQGFLKLAEGERLVLRGYPKYSRQHNSPVHAEHESIENGSASLVISDSIFLRACMGHHRIRNRIDGLKCWIYETQGGRRREIRSGNDQVHAPFVGQRLGLLARITGFQESCNIFIEGQEPQGTWVIGEFLNHVMRLSSVEAMKEKNIDITPKQFDILFSGLDFIAIVYARFQSRPINGLSIDQHAPFEARSRALRQTLARLFPEHDRISMLLSDADFPAHTVSLNGTAEVIWHHILTEALRRGPDVVERLAREALSRYPGDKILASICNELGNQEYELQFMPGDKWGILSSAMWYFDDGKWIPV